MPASPISAILIHVADPAAALAWYQRAFPHAIQRHLTEFAFDYLEIDGVQLELVQADAQVASGAAGSVVYWHCDDLAATLAHMQAVGAPLYRGPLAIEQGQAMCQVRDPWGNCIGLRGKWQPATSPE